MRPGLIATSASGHLLAQRATLGTVTVVSDLRQRWSVLDADDDGPDADDDAFDDEVAGRRRIGLPTRRLGGVTRIGMIAVLLFGMWIALAIRQRSGDTSVELPPSPRAVIDVPVGYAPSAVLAPDLGMSVESEGTWTLLAADDARLTAGPWVVVACRDAGSGEIRQANGLVTATLGTDLVVDSTGEDDVRVVATRNGDVTSAMVLDRRPTWISTVITAGWDGDTTDLARAVYDAAAETGCAGTSGIAAAATDLPVREERSLGLPVIPVGLRVASADETTVGWTGDEPGETIVLTSQRLGTGADDGDLIAFLRPPGDTEAEVLIGTTPAYRADNADGSEALIWHRDGIVHTLSLGPAVDADVVQLAGTLRTPDDAAWQALIDAVA